MRGPIQPGARLRVRPGTYRHPGEREPRTALPCYLVREADGAPTADDYDLTDGTVGGLCVEGGLLTFLRKRSHFGSARAVYRMDGMPGVYQSFWGEFVSFVEPAPADSAQTNAPWQALLPSDEVRRWAVLRIREEAEREGDEYDDNYRCAEEYDAAQEALFSEIEAGGCCGSHRFKAVGPDGRTYVLGYNHGH